MNLPVYDLMKLGGRLPGKLPVSPAVGGHSLSDIASLLQTPVRRFIVPDTPADPVPSPSPFPLQEHHNQRELHFILAGEIIYVVNQRTYCARPGDLLYVESWAEHGGRPASMPQKTLIAVFHFTMTPWACVNQCPMTPNDSILSDSWIFLPDSLSQFFLRRCREASAKQFDSNFSRFVRPASQAVLDDYARAFARRVRQRRLAETDPLEKIAVYIRDHSGTNCSNTVLSTLSGIPVHQLRAKYLARFGVAPREAIDAARLDLCRFARINAIRQKEIADVLGFASVQSFSRWTRGR